MSSTDAGAPDRVPDRVRDRVERTGARLAAAFERVHRERMAGLPILHPDLRVAVVGGRDWQGHWLGVLITPWCMNLVLVPAPDSAPARVGAGVTLPLDFPAGRFDFTVSNLDDLEDLDDLGPFAACSLFSPMHRFADQAAAEATAAEVLAELFTPDSNAVTAAPQAAGGASAETDAAGISRRDLLRGSFRGG